MIAQRKWIPAQEETLMQQPRTRRVLLPSMQAPRPLLAGTLAGRGKPGEGPQHALGVMPECHQGLTTTPSHPSCSGKAAATRPALLQQCCYDGLRARGTLQSQPPWRRKCSFSAGIQSTWLLGVSFCLLAFALVAGGVCRLLFFSSASSVFFFSSSFRYFWMCSGSFPFLFECLFWRATKMQQQAALVCPAEG